MTNLPAGPWDRPEVNPYEPPRARTIRPRPAAHALGSGLKQGLDALAVGVAGLAASLTTFALIFATGNPAAMPPPLIQAGGPAGVAILTGWGVARWLGRRQRRASRRDRSR